MQIKFYINAFFSVLKSCLGILWILPMTISSQLSYTHYTTNDDLPHDFTFQVNQDALGYLWIGTDDGLARFNGKDFKVFDQRNGFTNNFIIEAQPYQKDTMVAAVWKGGLHFMVKDSAYPVRLINRDNNSLLTHSVEVLGKDIFAIGGEIQYFNKQQSHTHKIHSYYISIDNNHPTLIQNIIDIKQRKKVYNVYRKIKNQIYFFRGIHSQNDSGVFPGIYQFVPDQEKIQLVFPFLKHKLINALGSYSPSTFYATEKDSLFIFNTERILQKKKYPFDGTIHQYANTSYAEIVVVNESQTKNDDIHIFDKRKQQWQKLSNQINSNPNILVSDVYIDQQEQVWITTKADGLYKIIPKKEIVTQTHLKNEHVIDIGLGTNEELFFLTTKKIHGFHPQSQILESTDLKSDAVDLFNQQATNKREIKIKFIRILDQEFSLLGHTFTSKDIDGIVNYSSVTINNTLNEKEKYNISDQLQDAIITDVKLINHQMWVATTQGIVIYDPKTETHIETITFGANRSIQKIVFAEGKGVYAISQNGLLLLQNDNGVEKEKTLMYDETHGLKSSKINDIFLDHNGTLWIATQKGFSIFKDGLFYNFSKKQGFESSFASKIIEDKNHQIWIGGNKGVVQIDNTVSFEPITTPQLIVEEQSTLFHIDVIDYSEIDVSTQYRIGPEDSWKNLEGKTLDIAAYKPDTYTIQFRSRNDLSDWNYSAVYVTKVQQPWYQTRWFTILIMLLISSLIILRLRSIAKRNKLLKKTIAQSVLLEKELSTVRENVAQDFHDELGNKLAGITVLSDLMAKDQGLQDSQTSEMAKQVNKDAKDLYFGIKDFVWSIDSKSDDLRELMIYLSDFGEELFSNKGIVFKVTQDLDEDPVTLPYYWSRQLLLLFKETMTNTLKHAQATKVQLIFIVKKGRLTISFTDNGKGFDPDTLKRKNGLLNIKKRVDRIGGQLHIDAKQGTTTTFTGKIR